MNSYVACMYSVTEICESFVILLRPPAIPSMKNANFCVLQDRIHAVEHEVIIKGIKIALSDP